MGTTLARDDAVEQHVADVFRRAGWNVTRRPSAGTARTDLRVQRGQHSYIVEVKSAAEGRRDRLMPLLAQAIFEELFRRWQGDGLRPGRDVPMRWILKGDSARQPCP
jgi:hypothetical protein